MAEFTLDVVTPEKSVVKGLAVDSVILPGELGQMNALPGHINLTSSLSLGSFAYRSKGDWQWAVLGGGFAQIRNGHITVLAETLDLAHEVDLAAAELEVQNLSDKMKKLSAGTPEYSELSIQKAKAEARVQIAKKLVK